MTAFADRPVPAHVQAFMDRKAAEPGFGKRRYSVRTSVGKATVTLHKSARVSSDSYTPKPPGGQHIAVGSAYDV